MHHHYFLLKRLEEEFVLKVAFRREYWGGLTFPSPGDLPDPGMESRSPALQADALTSEPPGKPYWTRKAIYKLINLKGMLVFS